MVRARLVKINDKKIEAKAEDNFTREGEERNDLEIGELIYLTVKNYRPQRSLKMGTQ